MSGEMQSRDGATWAVVPFKGRHGSKRRLAALLDEQERASLGRAMLADVVEALVRCSAVDRVLVVTADPDTAQDDPKVAWLMEPTVATPSGEGAGLNAALRFAQGLAVRADVTRLLIVLADLPLLESGDVEGLLEVGLSGGTEGPFVGIAPDGALTGTNALLLRPPAILEPQFGRDSFHTHVAWAGERRLPYAIVRRPGLALDIDSPEDLARFLEVAPPGETLTTLESFGIAARLGVASIGHDLAPAGRAAPGVRLKLGR